MINTTRRGILAAGLVFLAGLNACTTTEKAANPSRPEPAATNARCTLKVLQYGTEINPQYLGATPMYSLRSAPFQIEVSSQACEPSIGNVRDMGDVIYLTDKPIAISSTGMSMAGSPADDVLIRRNMDVRPDDETLKEMFGGNRREIEKLCVELGKCPVQILAYRNYWPFIPDEKGTQGKVATFKRVTETRPISNAFGPTPLVVFTKARRDEAEFRTGIPSMSILAVHPMLLLFSPR